MTVLAPLNRPPSEPVVIMLVVVHSKRDDDKDKDKGGGQNYCPKCDLYNQTKHCGAFGCPQPR